MMTIEIKPLEIVRAFAKLMVLSMIIGPMFWWFLVELAEHGWK